MYYLKQNQGAMIYFCLLFLFFPFSISHSIVMNIGIFVKDFTGNTKPRIFKLEQTLGMTSYTCTVYKIISQCLTLLAFQVIFSLEEVWPLMATAGGM